MPLSYYKRILFIALLAYSLLIVFHKAVSHNKKPSFQSKSNISLKLPLRRAEVEGIVKSYPRASGKRFRFNLAVTEINGEKIKTGIIIYLNNSNGFGFGDKVLLKGTLGNIYSDKVPGNLDWKEYLEIRGINGRMLNPKAEVLEKAGFLFRLSRNIHRHILKVFNEEFDSDHSAILSGIVIGEKTNIPKSLKRSFQDSGAMHLLVASGSNVGFMAFIVYFICALARLKKGLTYFISIAVCGIYVLSAGLDPPLVRAYIMFMFALAGFLISRESGVFQGLLMSGFAILIYEPNALFDAGFQMSFIATYGIIAGMASWNKFIKGGIFLKAITGIFAVSLFAQLGLYPLMAVYFHRISLISAFSNIIFVPFSGVLMTLGLFTAAFSKIPLFGDIISQVTLYSLKLFKFFVVSLGGFGYSAVFVSSPSVFIIIAAYILIFIILHMPVLGFKNKKMYMTLGAAFLIFLAGFFTRKNRDISLFYHGRHSCAFLKNPDCGLVVLNAGIAGDKLTQAVLETGYTEIEILLLSSLSADYMNGLKELSENIRIKNILIPFGYRAKRENEILKELIKKGVHIEEMWPGEQKEFCNFKAGPRWGLHAYADGKSFRNEGYAGEPFFDRLSWHFESLDFNFEFARFGNGIRLYKNNKAIGKLGNKAIRDIKARKGKIIRIEI
ncbi:MAG: ComEC/Rec2 family competence protein [Elusimicrobiales bacterium]|nr:ComEC/Rec2 family competence protein [Elusimicrobiales bacterium]